MALATSVAGCFLRLNIVPREPAVCQPVSENVDKRGCEHCARRRAASKTPGTQSDHLACSCKKFSTTSNSEHAGSRQRPRRAPCACAGCATRGPAPARVPRGRAAGNSAGQSPWVRTRLDFWFWARSVCWRINSSASSTLREGAWRLHLPSHVVPAFCSPVPGDRVMTTVRSRWRPDWGPSVFDTGHRPAQRRARYCGRFGGVDLTWLTRGGKPCRRTSPWLAHPAAACNTQERDLGKMLHRGPNA